MRNIWLVIKHEISTTFRKKSFWLLTFLMPVILVGFNTYYIIQENDLRTSDGDEESEEAASAVELPTIGLVDDAGLVAEIPVEIPEGLFVPFADATTARKALEAEEIDQYVHIPDDYLASGEVNIFDREFQILQSGDDMGVAFQSKNEWMLNFLISYNLTGDGFLATKLRNPTPGVLAEYHRVSPPDEASEQQDGALAQIVATAIPYLYYFILIISAGYMLQSVTAEKENRTVEVLLLSLQPRQLMIGKILGLTVVVLVQIAVWFSAGMLTLGRGVELFNLSEFTFPPGFLIWAFLFLILGYLLYASAMAAAGAVANTAREGNQMTWILILPLMPTLMAARAFLENPHGTFSVVLSLFPFSAPSAMVTRMAVATVPLWQILLSLAGLVLTAYVMVSLAGRFFRPHNLLSTTAFNWRRFATAWRD
jgi:ABC-2 type transport system permease protein